MLQGLHSILTRVSSSFCPPWPWSCISSPFVSCVFWEVATPAQPLGPLCCSLLLTPVDSALAFGHEVVAPMSSTSHLQASGSFSISATAQKLSPNPFSSSQGVRDSPRSLIYQVSPEPSPITEWIKPKYETSVVGLTPFQLGIQARDLGCSQIYVTWAFLLPHHILTLSVDRVRKEPVATPLIICTLFSKVCVKK